MKIGPLELSDTSLTHHGVLYMRRWVAEVPWLGGVRLHYIAGPDPSPDPHDHPFDFVSFVLRGEYTEETPGGGIQPFTDAEIQYPAVWKRRRWLSLAYRPAEAQHKVLMVSPGGCWTLVLSGRRRRTWGYVTARGWVDFRTYLEATSHELQG